MKGLSSVSTQVRSRVESGQRGADLRCAQHLLTSGRPIGGKELPVPDHLLYARC